MPLPVPGMPPQGGLQPTSTPFNQGVGGQQSHPPPPSVLQPPEPADQKMQRKMALIADAIALLRQDKLRGFRIDIETDSTIQGDAQQEKEQRIQFVEGVTKFIEISAQTVAMAPEFAPLAAKMLQFAVRGFRVGRDLESAIEDFCEKAEMDAKAAAANPQQKQDPEAIKAQAVMIKAQGEINSQQIEAASEAQNKQMEAQIKQMDVAMKRMEIQIAEMRAEAEMAKVHGQMIATGQEHALEAQSQMREHVMEGHKHNRELELLEAQHASKMKQAKEPQHGG
jgi:hypothetical protein